MVDYTKINRIICNVLLLNKMSLFVLSRKYALFFSIRTRAEFLSISSPNDLGYNDLVWFG